jgi:hypothetical protein
MLDNGSYRYSSSAFDKREFPRGPYDQYRLAINRPVFRVDIVLRERTTLRDQSHWLSWIADRLELANFPIRSEAIDPAVGVTRGVAPAGTWSPQRLHSGRLGPRIPTPTSSYIFAPRPLYPAVGPLLLSVLCPSTSFRLTSLSISTIICAFLIEESGIPPSVSRGG